MKWFAVPALFLAVSCGSGQTAYLGGVRPLSEEKAHPLYQQLLPLLEHPRDITLDQLIQTWKAFLGDALRPLRQESTFTFVYYDFTHTLKQVYLEASFAPQKELMTRVAESPLFVRVYTITKPAAVRYRFSDGAKPLPDPFQADLEPGDEFWQPLTAGDAGLQWVLGASEPNLAGQDLHVLLPPSYRTDLAQTYPLVVVAGLEGQGWSLPLDQMMRDGSIKPVIVVSVGSVAGLKTVLEDHVVPWMRSHYRASVLPSDLVLVGWGPSAQTTQEIAAQRPEFWSKTWSPLADQARGEEAWNTLAPPFFRTQFPVVNP